MVDCNQCARRGKLNGLSQETYCSGCIYSDRWKKDYFVESKKKNSVTDAMREFIRTLKECTEMKTVTRLWCAKNIDTHNLASNGK